MVKKNNYLCPRCGFNSNNKYDTKRHLFNLKKTCPAINNDIELTDEIKNYILDNRIYKIPIKQTPQQIINNNIYNYNQINNYINNMDNMDKINKLIKIKNIELTDLDDKLEESYISTVYKLKNNKYKDYQLKFQNIMEIIDEITTINDISQLNILYDEILNKIKIFCDGEWKSLLLEIGITDIINKLQSSYLDAYECYLIRKIINESSNYRYVAELEDSLMDYYKFLAWFDIIPYVYEKNDNKILYNNDNDVYYVFSDKFDISDMYFSKYQVILAKINKTEQNKVKRGIENIIRKNTKSFFLDLNKKLLDSFNNDNEFKQEFIKDIQHLNILN